MWLRPFFACSRWDLSCRVAYSIWVRLALCPSLSSTCLPRLRQQQRQLLNVPRQTRPSHPPKSIDSTHFVPHHTTNSSAFFCSDYPHSFSLTTLRLNPISPHFHPLSYLPTLSSMKSFATLALSASFLSTLLASPGLEHNDLSARRAHAHAIRALPVLEKRVLAEKRKYFVHTALGFLRRELHQHVALAGECGMSRWKGR